MAVRSNYIKSLMETKKTFDKQYEDVLKESVENIIGDNAKEEVRKLLKESDDEDSYTEEEVVDDAAVVDKDKDNDSVDDEEFDSEGGDALEDGDVLKDDDALEDNDTLEDGDDTDDIWDDLESCKSADGEYDCRGMDDKKLIKVLKSMGPEDGIRVMSNDDGTIELEVDGDVIQGKQEFIIDLDTSDDDEDFDTEIELVSDVDECNESKYGYTSDYQGETAMTTPNNNEPANPKTTYSMDGGVPTGVEKPFANQGKKSPYDKKVNENDEELFEVEIEDGGEEMLDEIASTTENNPSVRGNAMTHANTNNKGKKFRSSSEGGRRVKGTGENSYSGAETNESVEFKRKVNRLYEENKQMKSIIPELNKKLVESMVINASMGYIVRILNENTTTVDEKKRITERFAKVNTLEEGKKLYESISNELKSLNKRNTNVNDIMNSQLTEGKQAKQNLVETTMYKSEKVNEALDFMKRLDKIS